MTKKTIAIIGGGISGIAIALRLSEKGYKVILLERQKIAGGLAASIPYKGCMIDIGPHILLLPKSGKIHDEIVNMMGKSNLQEIHWPWAESYTARGIFRKSYPLFYDVLFNFGIIYFVKGILDIISNSIKNSISRPTFKNAEEYFLGTYGKFLYNSWFKPFFAETYQDLQSESMDFAKSIFHPITLQRIIGFIKKRINLMKNPYNPSKEFFNCYPKNGMGSFIKKMVDAIIKNNGDTLLGAEIKSIEHSNETKSLTYTLDEKDYRIEVAGIIYSIPLPITLQWFDNMPNEINNEIQKLKTFNSIMIFLIIESPLLFNKWIITVYDQKSVIFRISQQSYLSKNISPNGTTLLCIELKTTSNNKLETFDDAHLLELVKKDLKRIKVLQTQKIIESKIIRLPNIYPMNTSNTADTDRIIEYITSFKNEYVINTVIDAGRLASTRQENDESKLDPRATGVYRALLNADALTKRILNEIKLD